ncbi:MAG: hypothetical protein JRN15_03680 [Nitrososphaerota archaeon]|nr:hypothetical protein [Nitrososphaerota archaeon]
MSEEELWGEMCLCILASNVNYETALSAYRQLQTKGLIDVNNLSDQQLRDISSELSRPIFLPLRRDGSYRKYRFPNIRAQNIIAAHSYFYRYNAGIQKMLCQAVSDVAVRAEMAENVPGIGLKEASNFLRNIKFSENLAIIDSHIVNFLRKFAEVDVDTNVVKREDYLRFESIIQSISATNKLSLAILDIAVWKFMRGS